MGDWHAIDVIEQAVEDVKDLLLPFKLTDWLKMVVVVLFAGSTFAAPANTNFFPSLVSEGTNIGHMTANGAAGTVDSLSLSSLAVQSPAYISLFVLIGLAVIIGWMFVAATMEFVFISICRDKAVAIKQHFTDNTEKGWRLLGFQVLLGVLLIAILGISAAFGAFTGLNPLIVILIALIVIVGVIAFGLIQSLTIDFVTVKMLNDDARVLESWDGFFDTLKDEWLQVLIYLLVKLGLGIAAGIIYGIAFVLALIGFAIVGILLYAVLFPVFQAAQVVALIIAVPLALLFLGVFLIVMLGLNVPIASFFRFYSIRVFEKLVDTEIVG